jgi:hypothetical protein
LELNFHSSVPSETSTVNYTKLMNRLIIYTVHDDDDDDDDDDV